MKINRRLIEFLREKKKKQKITTIYNIITFMHTFMRNTD